MAKLKGNSLFLNLLLGNWQDDDWWDEWSYRFKFRLKLLLNPIITTRYIKKLSELDNAKELLETRPFLPTKQQRPYLHKDLNLKGRINAILDHYYFIQNIDNPFLKKTLLNNDKECLLQFKGKDETIFTLFCMPSKYDKEGEITLSLEIEGISVANLSFTFMKKENKQIVFIAGLQGAGKSDQILIKKATKACYGLFPKRVLYEAFCALVQHCKVKNIHAVSNEFHIYNQWRYKSKKKAKFVANYNEFWESIGGYLENDLNKNHFILPNIIKRKSIEEVASKKRAEYRNRYLLLDKINHDIATKYQLLINA